VVWDTSGSQRGVIQKSRFESWITLVGVNALAEVCALWTQCSWFCFRTETR